jgi:hypothetical protein
MKNMEHTERASNPEGPSDRFSRLIRSQPEMVCPYLGFEDDPETHASYASRSNYCHFQPEIRQATGREQRNYCLSTAFTLCPIYQPPPQK